MVSQAKGADWLKTDPGSGVLLTELKEPGRRGQPLYSDVVIIDGDWHRVAFVWEGICRSLYVDDALMAEDTQSRLDGHFGGLNIGCGKDMALGTFFSGLIDDVRICNRAVKP